MRYENRSESRIAVKDKAMPDVAGFYWAKWRIPEDGTEDEEHFVSVEWWEVVEVFDSFGDDEAPLRVAVAGVKRAQSLENFVWYKPITPLSVPS